MEQSFTRPSLSDFYPDSRTECLSIKQPYNQEAITKYWRTKFEEEQSAKQNLADKLAEEKDRNQILANELAEEQFTNNSLANELVEEQNVLHNLANELKKEKVLKQNIAYNYSKEKLVSHRLRLEKNVYMVCFSIGAISILMHDLCAKLF